MGKNFGLSKKSNNSRGWFESDAYNDAEIEALKDPAGGVVTVLPTSIPSPFARIDLVKSAFRNISKSETLKASNEKGVQIASVFDEKLVSDALDLAEIIFNIDIPGVSQDIKIIVWDREQDLAKLKAGSPQHRRFAETLELYLKQDSEAYNFDLLKRLYLIQFRHEIIGCTSPSTLFFTTANDLSGARMTLTGNNVTFDGDYEALHERDEEFQRYLHHLFVAHPTLVDRLPEMYEYLEQSKKLVQKSNPGLFDELNTLNPAEFRNRFSELNTGIEGDLVEVIGIPLAKRGQQVGGDRSDFRIKATKPISGKVPLVLQNKFSKGLLYVNAPWKSQTVVPYVDAEINIESRRLPDLGIQYPYLTVSDFLEPYLIRLIYPIDRERFFDGNATDSMGGNNNGFLLPLKKKFFEYFSASDLLKGGPGMPSIEIKRGAGNSARVSLRIPIAKSGEAVTFSRDYFKSEGVQASSPDEDVNQGVIVTQEMGLSIFPFLKPEDPNISHFYRIQVIDCNYASDNPFKSSEYNLGFYSDKSTDRLEIKGGAPKTRRYKTSQFSNATTKYYAVDYGFDYIEVESGFAKGIVVPKWRQAAMGQSEFQFAVDFGTSNTHIEYKAEKPAVGFDVAGHDAQLATLIDPGVRLDELISIQELINKEFIPRLIGRGSDGKNIYRFPQRTALSESKTLDLNKETFALSDFNIAFTYEKQEDENDAQLQTNLKWAKRDDGNEKRVRAFLEELVMMMRNKVLLNGGRLDKTKLIWFYPSSMRRVRLSALENEWNTLFKKYFGTDSGTSSMAESLAPFFYFNGAGILSTGSYKPVVGIDIGGGTTDVVVFQNDLPRLLTSFRFAANSLFGEGYTESGANSNGLARKYQPKIEALLQANGLNGLRLVLSSIAGTGKSEDINAFFFSIENAPGISEPEQFSYNQMLFKDEEVKILFVYFYAAILYHIAALMKQEGIEKPKNLLFSGTGSKILNIIAKDNKILAEFSKKIFEHVYGAALNEGLSVHTEANTPKEVTCKGGLMADSKQLEQINLRDIKSVLRCGVEGSDSVTYAALDDAFKEGVVSFVREFNDFFIKLDKDFGFADNFGVSKAAFSIFKEGVNQHLRDYLEQGIKFVKKMDDTHDDSEEVGESLFFFPIIGTMASLMKSLTDVEGN